MLWFMVVEKFEIATAIVLYRYGYNDSRDFLRWGIIFSD
jgi:hypothetical protein